LFSISILLYLFISIVKQPIFLFKYLTMTNFNLFYFYMLLLIMRGLTIPFSSFYIVIFIFVSTVIITYVSLLISKKLGYFTSYLNYLNNIINFINFNLLLATCLVVLTFYINNSSDILNLYCIGDDSWWKGGTFEATFSDVQFSNWLKNIGEVAVFTTAMKATTQLIHKAPYPPLVKIGIVGISSAGYLALFNSKDKTWSAERRETIKAEEINVKVTLDNKLEDKYKLEEVSKEPKTNINSPLEDGDNNLGNLIDILDEALHLSIICALLNYFILLHVIWKKLAENHFQVIKKIPFVGNKLYSFYVTFLPQWQKTSNFLLLFGLLSLLIFLVNNSYTLYYLSTNMHIIFK
jgi:hypothetical protein